MNVRKVFYCITQKYSNMKVFLGGTCNNSTWREKLIPNLKMDYFNPVVPIWDEQAQLIEIKEKDTADFLLFVITPLMSGVYSIAEVVDASNKKPKNTILCILDEDSKKWTKSQRDSLSAVENLVQSNGAFVFNNLEDTTAFLNQYY